MPLFDFRCDCGERFERFLTSWRADNPACPHCGAPGRRLPGCASLVGGARPPVSADQAPTSWEGTGRGNREYVARWRHALDKRSGFEEKYPELATKREAVAAHEGRFEHAPLTYRELAERSVASGDANQAAMEASRARTETPGVSTQITPS